MTLSLPGATFPLTRKPLRRVSKKKAAFARELKAVIPHLIERADGHCEMAGWDIDCHGEFHPHHRLRRSQGGGNDLDNLLWLCRDHHAYAHRYVAVAYEQGWLIRSGL